MEVIDHYKKKLLCHIEDPVNRQTKLTCIDSAPKVPRGVKRAQEKNGRKMAAFKAHSIPKKPRQDCCLAGVAFCSSPEYVWKNVMISKR